MSKDDLDPGEAAINGFAHDRLQEVASALLLEQRVPWYYHAIARLEVEFGEERIKSLCFLYLDHDGDEGVSFCESPNEPDAPVGECEPHVVTMRDLLHEYVSATEAPTNPVAEA